MAQELQSFIQAQERVLVIGVSAAGEFTAWSSFPEQDAFAICYAPGFGDNCVQVIGANISSEKGLVGLLSRSAMALARKVENGRQQLLPEKEVSEPIDQGAPAAG